MDSILFTASVAVPDSAPTASIWHAFLHGAAFGAGILAAFAAFCGALLAGDAARRRAVARSRLRHALAELDTEDIVTLMQQHGGNAELQRYRPAVRPRNLGYVNRPYGIVSRAYDAVSRAAARPAWRPENRQTPRKVPSRER